MSEGIVLAAHVTTLAVLNGPVRSYNLWELSSLEGDTGVEGNLQDVLRDFSNV